MLRLNVLLLLALVDRLKEQGVAITDASLVNSVWLLLHFRLLTEAGDPNRGWILLGILLLGLLKYSSKLMKNEVVLPSRLLCLSTDQGGVV